MGFFFRVRKDKIEDLVIARYVENKSKVLQLDSRLFHYFQREKPGGPYIATSRPNLDTYHFVSTSNTKNTIAFESLLIETNWNHHQFAPSFIAEY